MLDVYDMSTYKCPVGYVRLLPYMCVKIKTCDHDMISDINLNQSTAAKTNGTQNMEP